MNPAKIEESDRSTWRRKWLPFIGMLLLLALVVLFIIWLCWPVRDVVKQAEWVHTVLHDSSAILIEPSALVYPKDADRSVPVMIDGVNPTSVRLTTRRHYDTVQVALRPQGVFSRNPIRFTDRNHLVTTAHDPTTGRFHFTFFSGDNVIATVTMSTSILEDSPPESVYCEIVDMRTQETLFGFCAGPTPELWDLVRP